MKNEMIGFVKELKDIECYVIMTNKGVRTHAKANEALSLLSCLVNSLSKELPKEVIEAAVKTGFEHSENKSSKDIKKLAEALEKLGELLDE